MRKLILFFTFTLTPGYSIAEEIRVAVASNFIPVLSVIAKRFEARTRQKVTLISGSTGKLYAQINNGAPYDAFFAADATRPERLEKAGLAITGSRFTYAIGKLVLWSPNKVDIAAGTNILQSNNFRYIAIANPKLAPYGQAAKQVLQSRGLWDDLKPRLVRGENIGQTFQFVKSGNAELGFIAMSQIKHPGKDIVGSFWEVPQTLYTPIQQQAVLLKDKKTTRRFMSFMRSNEVLEIIHSYEYNTP